MPSYQITTIKPVASSMPFVSFKPRSKEGEAEKPECFVSYDLPESFASLHDASLSGFLSRAYAAAMTALLRDAIKAGKDSVHFDGMDNLFATGKREFLITKPDLLAWINDYALPILTAAIALKANLHIDSPKVVKKGIAYRDQLLCIASRQIMSQEAIDSALRVCELLDSSGKPNAYTDNVLEAIARKQTKLDEFNANGDDSEDDIDF